MKSAHYKLNRISLFIVLFVFICGFATSVFAGGYFTVDLNDGEVYTQNGDFRTTAFTPPEHMIVNAIVLECLADKQNDAGNEEFEVAITHDAAGTDVVGSTLWWREAKASLTADFNPTDGYNYDTNLYLFDIPDTRLWNVYTYYLRTKVLAGAPAETWGKAYIFYGGAPLTRSRVGHGRQVKQIHVPNGQHYWNAGDFVTTKFQLYQPTKARYVTMFCLDDSNNDAGNETFEVAICTSSDGNDVLTSAQITANFGNNGTCDGHKYSFDFPDVNLPPGTYYLRTKAISGCESAIRAWGGAQLYWGGWSDYTYKKMQSPPDVDKYFHGHQGSSSCWMATASNMLAAAGYGTGSTVQVRADSIYLQMTGKWGVDKAGWPDSAMKWWLSSAHNTWTTNPYIWVGSRGNRDSNMHFPYSNSTMPQIIGNKLRKCEYISLAFFWGNKNIGHVVPVWGDSGRTAENDDWPMTNNPAKVIVSDSDRGDNNDNKGDLQTYTYNYTTESGDKAWKIDYGSSTDPWVRCLITLARSTIDPLGKYQRWQRIIGSYKVTKPGQVPDAAQLHYVVGPQSGTLSLYDTYIDWDTNSVPSIELSTGAPEKLTVNWDLSDNPVPYQSTVTITTELGIADGGGIWYKNVGFPGIYANIPDFGVTGIHNNIGSIPYEPNDPDMTGGYIYGAMDVTDGNGNDSEFRWVDEYDYDQDPEWHNIIVSPHPEATEVYQISNLRFGHAYGLPDVCDLWNFTEWWSEFPGPYDLIPAGPSHEFELNWAGQGLIPYPISNNYQGTEDPPTRSFVNEQNLQGVWHGDSAWGDFDNDGDLDLVICGKYPYSSPWTRVTLTYENQSGTLVQKAQADLIGVSNESGGGLAWGDYDGDGDLDLAIAGLTDDGTRITRIYKNDGTGTLTHDTNQILIGVSNAALAWGDYDNDGDLDLVVTGYDGTEPVSILYKNHPLGTLTADSATSLIGLHTGSADWADIDGDGDLDLLLTGHDGDTQRAIFYINNPVGTLTDGGQSGLNGVNFSDVAFGDYDNDGDMDIALTGTDGGGAMSRVYKNDGTGLFVDAGAGLRNMYRSSVAWADYDNDGDLDLVICGYTGTSLYTELYENTNPGFSVEYTLAGVREGSVNFADVNEDGDIDFFLTGADWTNTYSRLYSNEGGLSNISPAAPDSLICTPDDVNGGILLEWSGAQDNETPYEGLYYAVRVGTEPGENDILSGTYSTPLMGNRGQMNRLFLNVPINTYYWSVKTIDSGLKASNWAIEQVCRYCPGDVDLDCDVDFIDFAIMANAWLTELAQMDQNYNELCDISDPPDNVIDFKDLGVLSENWLLNS